MISWLFWLGVRVIVGACVVVLAFMMLRSIVVGH